MRYFLVTIIIVGALGACTTSAGIIPAGPNAYALTVRTSPILGGAMAAQPEALRQATTYCNRKDGK